MSTLSLAPNKLSFTQWFKFLSRWSWLFIIFYIGLVVCFMTLVIPAGQSGLLPPEYFELTAASREPAVYHLTIAFDVSAWLALGGLFVAFAAILRPHTPIRSEFIALSAAGMLIGFLGACLRFAGTPQLAAQYLLASASQREVIVQSYSSLLSIINITFNAGGFFQGIAMLLIASAARYLLRMPRWSTVLIGLSGFLSIVKGVGELTTGIDLGPLSLLAGLLLIISLLSIIFWKETNSITAKSSLQPNPKS